MDWIDQFEEEKNIAFEILQSFIPKGVVDYYRVTKIYVNKDDSTVTMDLEFFRDDKIVEGLGETTSLKIGSENLSIYFDDVPKLFLEFKKFL